MGYVLTVEGEIWCPIMMLTAKDGELDEAEALDTGADLTSSSTTSMRNLP